MQRHTEGNPLFIVNVLRDLALRGLLVERDGQWSARSNIDAASLGIPEDVRRTIEQQIDRLAAPERKLLTVASACGASCSAAAIAAGAEVAVSDVESVLGALTRQNLFVRELGPAQWPDGTDAANFEFLHALYREVLAHRIPPRAAPRSTGSSACASSPRTALARRKSPPSSRCTSIVRTMCRAPSPTSSMPPGPTRRAARTAKQRPT